MAIITSLNNPSIQALARLKERKYRKLEQLYLIEGKTEITKALAAKVIIEKILICPEICKNFSFPITSIPQIELPLQVFKKLSYCEKPAGLIAVAKMQNYKLSELKLPTEPLVLVIDGLEKPGNIGALLRTATATGVNAVFVTGKGTDLYNPNVIRSSLGNLFNQPTLHSETHTLVKWLRNQKINIIATSPTANLSYWDINYQNVAIVLGAEHQGLSEQWLQNADTTVRIPMLGNVDSLNVATSGALLMYEALKQKQLKI